MHEERNTRQKSDDNVPEGAVPAYLLDREDQSRAKVLSNMIKQKRKEKAVSMSMCVCVCETFFHVRYVMPAEYYSHLTCMHLYYFIKKNYLWFCRASGMCRCRKLRHKVKGMCSKLLKQEKQEVRKF